MKKKQFAKLSIIFSILIYVLLAVRSISFAGTLSSDIDGIDESAYPGVKSLIQSLQASHSNYTFQVYYTGIDWTEAVTMEYQGHGSSPKNLFSASNSYKGKWYCPICGSTTYDTGWYCASIEAIEYMMDPRNSLDETSVFQFKTLDTSDVSASDISAVISNKYSSYSYINNSTAINAIVQASEELPLNGYSILAKIINEQGSGTSPLVTGAGYNGQYVGYYNFFNVGAYGNGTATVITNGLKYAANKGWNSVESSILGGAEYYKSQYIGKGQNTLYYQRFNVVYTTSLFSHQYQQDIMGAQTSATLLKNYYTISSTISTAEHTFVIPLYENMPATACSRPSTTETSTLEYEEATVLTDKLAVRAAPNSSRIISYLNANEEIWVLERADDVSDDGNYWDTIVSVTDGTYGYVLRSGISKANNYPTYVFDYKYYADTYSDLKSAYGYNETKLYQHFIKYGISEGRSSSAVFNAVYYVENNSDLKAAFGTDYVAACDHFMNYGCKEYRKSSSTYDGFFYQYYYSDLTSMSSLELITHYMTYGISEGRIGGLSATVEAILFDATVYTTLNSDLNVAFGTNTSKLKQHWLQYGISEGRVASLTYSPEIYLTLYSDLQKAYGSDYRSLMLHFINYGLSEGRTSSAVFDVSAYLALNSDIKSAFGTDYTSSYTHFITYGISEGRTASYIFNVLKYLSSNSDLKAAFGTNYKSAFIHFLQFGMNELRTTSSTFSLSYYTSYSDLKAAYGTNYKHYYLHYLTYGRKEGRKAI